MMWNSAYYFKVTVHLILAELCPFENFSKLFVSDSLHRIKLKLDLQLDHDVEQCIFVRGYSPSNISRIMTL